MVLPNEEYERAKWDAESDARLAPLFRLRNDTKSYIVQCLADREIQKILNEEYSQCSVYRHNCRVIHSPHNYNHVVAGIGIRQVTRSSNNNTRSSHRTSDSLNHPQPSRQQSYIHQRTSVFPERSSSVRRNSYSPPFSSHVSSRHADAYTRYPVNGEMSNREVYKTIAWMVGIVVFLWVGSIFEEHNKRSK